MATIAVGQICSTASMKNNLNQCRVLARKAAAAGAKVFLASRPAYASDYIAASGPEMVALVKSIQDSEFVQGIREEAAECSLPINVGVHEPTHGGKTVQNTLLWIDERGDIKQRYQKLHLFDVDIKGGPVLKESNSVERGTKILPPFETGVGRVGLAICFDLRFPEMSLALRRQNAEIITFPSAFTVPTGQAHWEVLLRARAIETQAYIIAAAQCGAHNEKRTSYGHSMVVDPWGQIVAELGGTFVGPELATAKIDIDLLGKIRREIPLTRRTDVYPQV